jgi:hypothetical protein
LEIDLTAAEFFYFFKRSEPARLRAPKLFYAAYTRKGVSVGSWAGPLTHLKNPPLR